MLKVKLPVRTAEIRAAALAIGAANGRTVPPYTEPREPTPAEEGYLAALDLFRCRKSVQAWECLEFADALANAGVES
jgi:hypothetical protein